MDINKLNDKINVEYVILLTIAGFLLFKFLKKK